MNERTQIYAIIRQQLEARQDMVDPCGYLSRADEDRLIAKIENEPRPFGKTSPCAQFLAGEKKLTGLCREAGIDDHRLYVYHVAVARVQKLNARIADLRRNSVPSADAEAAAGRISTIDALIGRFQEQQGSANINPDGKSELAARIKKLESERAGLAEAAKQCEVAKSKFSEEISELVAECDRIEVMFPRLLKGIDKDDVLPDRDLIGTPLNEIETALVRAS